ncbi:uncharacterized protein LOC143263787 [Megalopta genalis]|uniref:uncharacterized protein LOC143263787 n=1 Tax=Megalopta genalis TaxID=115081 RepID=UPI003FD3CE73
MSTEPLSFTVKEALEFIPAFDGTNIPVIQFSRACKRARDIVPPYAERTLTKLICNKLRYRAYSALEDENCCTINELCNRLKEVFGPHRSVDQYRGDLASILQGQNEHILDYISRTKDLRAAILDCDDSHRNIENVDELTIDSFIRGLIPALRPEVSPHRNEPLNLVFKRATTAYKQYEFDKTRFKEAPRNFSSTVSPRNNYTYVRDRGPATDTAPRIDYNRQSYNPNRFNAPYNPSPRNIRQNETTYSDRARIQPKEDPRTERKASERNPTEAPKFCRYCKNEGHDIHECRKREYNNRLRDQGNAQSLPSTSPPRREAPASSTVKTIIEENEQNDGSSPQ